MKLSARLGHAIEEFVRRARRDPRHDEVVRPERTQGAAAHPDDDPAHLGEQPVLAPVHALALPNVLVGRAPDRVEFDGDRELGQHEIWPDFELAEERGTHSHGVGAQVDVESLGHEHPQPLLSR
ncbi:MAG: hypothetical protein ACJLS2_07770 [Microcella pacifica]